jgi:hypothetical protein
MKNAYAGIKRLYRAEILQLIACVIIFGAIVLLKITGIGENISAEGKLGSDSMGYAAVGGGMLIGGMVLEIVAIAQAFLGTKKASADEPIIKRAYYYLIVGLIAVAIEVLTSENTIVSSVAGFVGEVVTYLSIYYVLCGIVSISEKKSNSEISARAKSSRKILMFIMIFAALLRIMGVLNDVTSLEGIKAYITMTIDIAAILAAALEVIQFFIYLKILGKTKRMLEG